MLWRVAYFINCAIDDLTGLRYFYATFSSSQSAQNCIISQRGSGYAAWLYTERVPGYISIASLFQCFSLSTELAPEYVIADLSFITYAADYARHGIFADWLLSVISFREAKLVLTDDLLPKFEKALYLVLTLERHEAFLNRHGFNRHLRVI